MNRPLVASLLRELADAIEAEGETPAPPESGPARRAPRTPRRLPRQDQVDDVARAAARRKLKACGFVESGGR